jgi:hypothetical protein
MSSTGAGFGGFGGYDVSLQQVGRGGALWAERRRSSGRRRRGLGVGEEAADLFVFFKDVGTHRGTTSQEGVKLIQEAEEIRVLEDEFAELGADGLFELGGVGEMM